MPTAVRARPSATRSLRSGASAPSSAPSAPPPTDADIHARLFDALLGQRLIPGTRLREDELGRAFGVSRTRIRQVLIRLAEQQLVTLTPHAGARVTEPTPEESREVFAARRLIEPVLLTAFVARANAADLKALQSWIVQEERARAEGRRHDAIRHAGGFHLHIAQHAGNATLARMQHELVLRTSLVLMRWGPADIRDPTSDDATSRGRVGACDCHEHRTVLAAIKLRDSAAAGRAMLQHLARLEDQLMFEPPAAAPSGLAQLLGLSA